MGLLDPLFDALAEVMRLLPKIAAPLSALNVDEEGNLELAVDTELADELVENLLGGVFEQLESDVRAEITEQGYLTPDNVGRAVLGAEGAAIEDAIAGVGAGLGIEIAGGGELETHQFALSQILAFMGLEDVLGAELSMLYEKGVSPALEARIARETRSEYAALGDAVEEQLRNKNRDEGWLENLGTYGIRPDNVPILEEVAIASIEAEELLEEPPQYGVIPSLEVVEEELDRAGISEGAKDLFLQVIDNLPRATAVWEELTSVEETVSQLDQLVADGEITPQQAVDELPSEADDAEDALRERWRLLDGLPSSSPTRSQFESWFGWGLIDLSTFTDGIERVDVDPETYPATVGENILSEIDGDLRTALGVGVIDEGRYTELANIAGLDQKTVNLLLQGEDLDDIAEARLVDEGDATAQSTRSILDIGGSRAGALESIGIATVEDLANASVEDITSVLSVTDEFAQLFIDRAQRRIE
jgi:hypothetical protein